MTNREFVKAVKELAKANNLNCFVLTDTVFGVTNDGGKAITEAVRAHKQWAIDHGYDPNKDLDDN